MVYLAFLQEMLVVVVLLLSFSSSFSSELSFAVEERCLYGEHMMKSYWQVLQLQSKLQIELRLAIV